MGIHSVYSIGTNVIYENGLGKNLRLNDFEMALG